MSFELLKAEVRFFIEGSVYAIHFWNHVPAVGDHTLLRCGGRFEDRADKNGELQVRVTHRHFGLEKPNSRQVVMLQCEIIDP